jgi:hypothetical protein
LAIRVTLTFCANRFCNVVALIDHPGRLYVIRGMTPLAMYHIHH